MKLVEKDNNKAVFEMESHYHVHEYVVHDMKQLAKDGNSNWKLTRYEKRNLNDKKVNFVMTGVVSADGDYVEFNMNVGFVSRRIRVNPEGRVVCDYIVDSFPNPMQPNIFTAFGSHFDYSMKDPGLPIMEYLQGEQVFVNDKDKDDVLKNRWLVNDFFIEYLLQAHNLAKRAENLFSTDDYPQQLSLIPPKND